MKTDLPGDLSPPPGVITNRDSERTAGDWTECDWCGTETRIDRLNDDGLCRKCAIDLDSEN